MADTDFEKIKKIVRSVLIPCQRGCTLRDFLKAYRELNGANLPYGKLGFESELHLLQNMQDAVFIQRSRSGEVLLSAVADESTQHIQKMVSKQKAPKKKPPGLFFPAPTFSKRYKIPPRFIQKVAPEPTPSSNSPAAKKVAPFGLQNKIMKLISRFPSGLSLSDFLTYFEQVNGQKLNFRAIGFFTLEECLETVPNISMKTRNNDIFVYPKETEFFHSRTQSSAPVNSSSGNISNSQVPQNNVQQTRVENSLVFNSSQGNFSNGQVAQTDVQQTRVQNGSMFKSNQVSMSKQSTPSLEEENREARQKRNIPSTVSMSKHSTPFVEEENPEARLKRNISTGVAGASGGEKTTSTYTSSMYLDDFERPEDIPPFVLKSLQKLADLYPNGIKATEFPSVYEKAINTEFDLHSLGYNDLSVFINAVPNIFKRVEIFGNKKNWYIMPAGKEINEPKNESAILYDTIISNIRMLLEANPEGILINEFLHIYSINCSEPLYVREFGFTSLESFLMSNANQVPLMIASGPYGKVVHLKQAPEYRNPEPQYTNPEPEYMVSNVECPPDIVRPGADIPCVKLPPDLNNYFQVYVSNVENPSRIYVQLKEHSDELTALYDRIQVFYNSLMSDMLKMKSKHVTLNTVCMAKWPIDNEWYRVKIVSIPSLDNVQVFYFDYGTKAIIPVTLLRYMKKEFLHFPAQALLSSLASIMPANNSLCWSPKAKDKILSLSKNIPVMARVEYISDDGILQLVLCNTEGTSDVFINDELINDGLAEALNLEAGMTGNIQTVMTYLSDERLVASSVEKLSLNSPFHPPPGFLHSRPIPSPTPIPIPAPIPASSLYLPPAQDNFASALHYDDLSSSPTDSEVFDDDDDLFEQFYQKAVTVMKRYVKRVRTVDAYIFHIICVEGEPFVSCGDIAALIWDNQTADYLLQRLQNRQYHVPSLKIEEKENKDIFYQLEKFYVKGCKKFEEEESQILVCPLSNVIEILNLLGQPSGELRRQIQNELDYFNPSDPTWMELSEGEIPDKEELVISTEEDKLNRLCLYDLLAMKESIRLRAEKVQNNMARGGSGREEIMRLKHLQTRVVQRVSQIKEVCQAYNR